MTDKIKIGSGNVFKDLDYKDHEERLAKSYIISIIHIIINSLKIKNVSKVIGISQAKMDMLKKGMGSEFSLQQLVIFLYKLENHNND